MKFGVYCIRDIKSGWLSPTFDINDEVAIRNFTYAVQNNDLFSAFCSDYSLFKIGEFDSETGEIVNLPHVFLADVWPDSKYKLVSDEKRCDHE